MADEKKNRSNSFFEALIGQAINEWMRPLMTKLPPETLKSLKKVGFDKLLPIVSIAYSTIFPPGTSTVSDKASDLLTEFTAELRRVINEANEKGEEEIFSAPEKEAVTGLKTILNILFSPQFVNDRTKLMDALNETFDGKNEGEQKAILKFLSGLSPTQFYVFLNMDKTERDKCLATFVRPPKPGKTIEEEIQEFKEHLAKLGEITYENVIRPLDQKLGPDSSAGKATTRFRNWAERFKQGQADKRGKK